MIDYLTQLSEAKTSLKSALEAKDRLEEERDRLRVALKEALDERDNLAKSPDGGWQAMYDKVSADLHTVKCERADAVARAEAAEKNRDEIRHQWGKIFEEHKAIGFERDVLRTKLADAEKELDHMRSIVPELEAQLAHWKGRFVDKDGPGCVPNDEHQRMVSEVVALTDRLKTQADGLNKHWQEQVRLAKADGHRRARNLAAMLHAHVNAIAGESP